MKLAIIGGTRFVGHHAASLAVERGHRVWALHRGQHPCQVAGVIDTLVDRQDPSALCEALRRIEPDVIVDTRAMTRSQAQCTALALKIFQTPAVVLSSVDVYAQFGSLNGLPAPPPEPEVTEGSPLTIPFPFRELGGHEAGAEYDKKEVEAAFSEAAAEGAPAVTVLRLPGVLGARDHRRRFCSLVEALSGGSFALPCPPGGATWRLTHAHARDVAHAILLAAERAPVGYDVYNVGEAATPTMGERAESIAQALGGRVVWRETSGSLPPSLAVLAGGPHDLVISSARIRSRLGFSEITTPQERIADLIAWARNRDGSTPG